MSSPRAVVVQEASCPLEGWDDAVRGKLVWRTLLSGDRTPSSQLTLGVTEVGPGQPSPFHPHRHAQSEIYYVLSGEGSVHIDGEEHPLRAGTGVFIPGDTWHGARNTGSEVLRLLYVFAADSFGDVKYVFPGESDPAGRVSVPPRKLGDRHERDEAAEPRRGDARVVGSLPEVLPARARRGRRARAH